MDFERFLDVTIDTNNHLKTPDIVLREKESLVVYPRQPLPHEIARGARRLWPHELLVPLEPWMRESKPITPLPEIRKRMGGF